MRTRSMRRVDRGRRFRGPLQRGRRFEPAWTWREGGWDGREDGKTRWINGRQHGEENEVDDDATNEKYYYVRYGMCVICVELCGCRQLLNIKDVFFFFFSIFLLPASGLFLSFLLSLYAVWECAWRSRSPLSSRSISKCVKNFHGLLPSDSIIRRCTMEFFFPIYEEERKTFGEATEKKRLTPPCFLFSFLFFEPSFYFFPRLPPSFVSLPLTTFPRKKPRWKHCCSRRRGARSRRG